MKRYLRLYFHFFRNCWAREAEFRFNLIIWTFMNFLWFALAIGLVEVVFGQVQTIAGWNKNEVLLLVLTQQLFNDIFWTFVHQNLNKFSQLVRHGELDFVLLKPVNSRFWISARYFDFDHYLRMVALVFLIINLSRKIAFSISAFSWIGYFLLFGSGLFIFYNLFFAMTTTNFWFIRIFNLNELFNEISETGRMPVYIFRGGARLFFTYILPVAFIATFPVQMLLGRGNPWLIILGLGMGIVTFLFSHWFWHFGLRSYSSASS